MTQTPYQIHGFICTNDRHGERPSCGDTNPEEIRKALKAACKERGWWGKTVRISSSGCLGRCATGPNLFLYPDKIAFDHLTMADVPRVLATIEKLLG